MVGGERGRVGGHHDGGGENEQSSADWGHMDNRPVASAEEGANQC